MNESFYDDVISALKTQNAFVHVVTSGAGSSIQDHLWQPPGASAWLSGATFPYDQDETNELLGFKSSGVNHETAVHLACAAYMKAYKFNKSFTIGLGLTSSVASTRLHKGDHRIHACVITPHDAYYCDVILPKKVGHLDRQLNNITVREVAFTLLKRALRIPDGIVSFDLDVKTLSQSDLLNLVLEKPVFHSNGTRTPELPRHVALFPGAFNPPTNAHTGLASHVSDEHAKIVYFHITVDPQHKEHLTPQDVLSRAKLLKGHNVLFTRGDSLYLDKIKRFKAPIILGADALDRMLDPRWGVEKRSLIRELIDLRAKIYVSGRLIDDTFQSCESILRRHDLSSYHDEIFFSIKGVRWDISSTEVRNALRKR